ncbi:hypothetical protein Bca4012_037605 [Brassica carinata]
MRHNVDPPLEKDPSQESGARDPVPEDAISEEPAPIPIGEETNVVVSSDSSSSQQGDATAEDDDGNTVEEPDESEVGSPRRGISEEPPRDPEDVVANPLDANEEAARIDGARADAEEVRVD